MRRLLLRPGQGGQDPLGAGPEKSRPPAEVECLSCGPASDPAFPLKVEEGKVEGPLGLISEFVVTPKARVSVIGSLQRGELVESRAGGRVVRQVRLRLPATLTVNKALSLEITTFVDTGSEVSLVRRGLLPEEILQSTHRPVQLVTASGQPLRGGSREAWVDLRFMGHEVGKPGKVVLATPTRLLEADMEEDVLLSYEWLGDRDFDVHARRHGLMGHVSGKDIWVSGIKEDPKSQAKGSFTSVRAISACPTKRALDLFCGRKSAALAL